MHIYILFSLYITENTEFSIIKTHHLMLHLKTTTVNCQNHKEHKDTSWSK